MRVPFSLLSPHMAGAGERVYFSGWRRGGGGLFRPFSTSTSRPALFFIRVEPENGAACVPHPTSIAASPMHIMPSPHVHTKKSPRIASIYHGHLRDCTDGRWPPKTRWERPKTSSPTPQRDPIRRAKVASSSDLCEIQPLPKRFLRRRGYARRNLRTFPLTNNTRTPF